VVLRQPHAIEAFDDLLARGHMAGKLYALCGLRLLAPERYARAERLLPDPDEKVHAMFGCVRSVQRARTSSGPPTWARFYFDPGNPSPVGTCG
jgi:hypothetical protein